MISVEKSIVLCGNREIDVSDPSELSLSDLWRVYNFLSFRGLREELTRVLLREIHFREAMRIWEEGYVCDED